MKAYFDWEEMVSKPSVRVKKDIKLHTKKVSYVGPFGSLTTIEARCCPHGYIHPCDWDPCSPLHSMPPREIARYLCPKKCFFVRFSIK